MPAMVFCLYGYDLGGRGDGGRHCVLWTYVRHLSMGIFGYGDLPWILHVIFTLKSVRTVRRARKMAVTMVSTDGDQPGKLALSVVVYVVLSLGEP